MAKADKKAPAAGLKPGSKTAQAKPKAKTVRTGGGAAAKPSGRTPRLPRYDELPVRAGAPKGAAWGVFGDADQLGTINLMTPQCVIKAAAEIRTGRVFPLNLPINLPDPPLYGRGAVRHHKFPLPLADYFTDDYLDNFYPQASSQWDAVGHIKHPRHGYYNGIPESQVTGRSEGGTHLGIENLARRGIAGRGVLVDAARYFERRGKTIQCTGTDVITIKDLETALAEQKTRLRAGDILLVRVGWLRSYLASSPEVRTQVSHSNDAPGVESTTRWPNGCGTIGSRRWRPIRRLSKRSTCKRWVRCCIRICWLSLACRSARCGTWRRWPRIARRTGATASS